MNRGDFLKTSFFLALASCLPNRAWSGIGMGNRSFPDLVEVNGSDAQDMVLSAIEAMGGMSRFVQPGQRVLLKPTICFAAGPESHLNTHPLFLTSIIRLCQKAGAAQVYVVDNPIDDWRLSYQMSGLERATKITGNKPLPTSDIRYYASTSKGSELYGQKLRLFSMVEKCDVVINLTKVSIGTEGKVFSGFDNLSGLLWQRGEDYPGQLEEKLLTLHSICRPTLSLIEATTIFDRENHKYRELNRFIASQDWVAADSFLFTLMGQEPEKIDYLQKASRLGMGKTDLEQLEIEKIWV